MAAIPTLDSSLPIKQAGVDTHEYGKKIRLQQDFEEQLALRARNRHELGRIARELKRHYLFNGGGNGWTAYITKQGLEVRTVDRWIENFEIKEGLRPAKVFGQDVRTFSDIYRVTPEGRHQLEHDAEAFKKLVRGIRLVMRMA